MLRNSSTVISFHNRGREHVDPLRGPFLADDLRAQQAARRSFDDQLHLDRRGPGEVTGPRRRVDDDREVVEPCVARLALLQPRPSDLELTDLRATAVPITPGKVAYPPPMLIPATRPSLFACVPSAIATGLRDTRWNFSAQSPADQTPSTCGPHPPVHRDPAARPERDCRHRARGRCWVAPRSRGSRCRQASVRFSVTTAVTRPSRLFEARHALVEVELDAHVRASHPRPARPCRDRASTSVAAACPRRTTSSPRA